MLTELEESSFIKSFLPFNKEKKDTLYRLVDEYSVFYYQFNPQKNPAGSFIKASISPKYKSWAGFAFESLCIKHCYRIKKPWVYPVYFQQRVHFILRALKKKPVFRLTY